MIVAESDARHSVVQKYECSERDRCSQKVFVACDDGLEYTCSSQLHYCFLQLSYISICNLIYGVAATAVEKFGRKVQGSAVY